jgi:hypothetical protein
MANGVLIGLIAIAIFAPLILCLLKALNPSVRPATVEDYFLFERHLDAGSFATGSVGYSTQVASIYLFLLWFFTYGFAALIVPLAWGLGYVIMVWLVKSKALDSFLGTSGDKVVTIHGHIGKIFKVNASENAVRTLILVAAFSTLTGLGGTLITEVDYATRYFLLPSIGIPTNDVYIVLFAHLSFLLFSGFYVLWGGYKSVINTDAIQVKLAYFAFTIILLILTWKVANKGHTALAVLTSGLLTIFFYIFLILRKRIRAIDAYYKDAKNDIRAFLFLSVLSGILLLWLLLGKTSIPSVDFWSIVPSSNNVLGFGVIGVISLFAANTLWQIIDISCLQRLQSVRFTKSDEDRRKIAIGLQSGGMESASIWLLLILFAALIKGLGGTSSDNIPALLASLSKDIIFLLPLFAFLVTAFMMSTLDCLISASAFVSYYDLVGEKTNVPTEDPSKQMYQPRLVTLAVLIVIYIGYCIIRTQVSESHIYLVLYGFYAVQASILPLVIVALFAKRLAHVWSGIIAILSGWVLSLVTALSQSPCCGIPTDSWYVIPPLAAMLGSSIVYASSLIVFKSPKILQIMVSGGNR